MPQTGSDIRKGIEQNWHEYLLKYGNLFSSTEIQGSSPPSVFVGSYGYPKVGIGPMLPPVHGDTSLLDSPERWLGKSLEEIINFRLNLVRGIKKTGIEETSGRFIESLHELAMSSGTIDSEIKFLKNPTPFHFLDGQNAPFGPIGEIKSTKFSPNSSIKSIENAYYDADLKAEDAVMKLYNSGIEISKIQKCFSIGMFGKNRKLVPTKWSITATDQIISNDLMRNILEFDIIDRYNIFNFDHLGNLFSIVLFPHRWIFEMQEAWHDKSSIGFGSDYENAKGINHPPSIAGAYFAGKLAVTEYLKKIEKQSGVMIFREIQPEYAVPVGVWQVREGVREAMKQRPQEANSLNEAIDLATKQMSISKNEWLAHGNMLKLVAQTSIPDFF
jgi:DNA repair protein NreA